MDFLTYKGKPLVRKGNEIYYGDMSEKYVIKFDVLSEKEENGQKVPDKMAISLMLSDTSLDEKDRVKKKSEKQGFFEAMDLGDVWLTRALKD
ncbi:MAG: hypothetical protein IIW16_00495 [Clostridia bacterium]|nr:hypothetical protein [Clostridia bacterium]MBQ5798280.1 hypothetical protein [Clostridia bacterium]MBQ5901007.1 hypothetical protein [Clostridia bacterium]MEE1278044.1 hypothetical protein [Acutalibacteraceae bacterium]